MKKVLLIIMMIALIVSTSVFAKGFSDVDETMENYEEAISYPDRNAQHQHAGSC